MKPIHAGFLLTAVLMLSFSCKDIPVMNDYRKEFYGDYSFEVIARYWSVSDGVWWDTLYYDGVIRKYKFEDTEHNSCSYPSTPIPDSREKITIWFLQHTIITSGISKEGVLAEKQCYHYVHHGEFTEKGVISFTLSGLGGLGGGVTYYVTGVRKM